ncbi:MAG: class I SAM-dependent methyltransferase [Bacteroidota bacterium]
MTCSCLDPRDKYFSKQAADSAARYRKKGLDAPQRVLHRALTGGENGGKTLLEIGCGVGGLHLELLKSGFAAAHGVDVSAGMIDRARELAGEMGLAARVSYHVGDLDALQRVLPEVDVVVMDKVLCCDSNPLLLVRSAAAKTRDVLAVSYPRDGVLARLSFTLLTLLGRILHWSFHPFYHEPTMLHAAIVAEGFSEIHAATTPIWQIGVFRRKE